jgi:protein-tyrosine phosphatase
MNEPAKLAVLMVCLGNICRSPTAEAVLRAKLGAAGLSQRVRVDSAGTYAGHVGSPPDTRSQSHAARRGYDLSTQRARSIVADDFEHFDLIVAMDKGNLADLERACPQAMRSNLTMLMSFAKKHRHIGEIPDPYSGGSAGFERVLNLIEDACDGMVVELRERLAALDQVP